MRGKGKGKRKKRERVERKKRGKTNKLKLTENEIHLDGFGDVAAGEGSQRRNRECGGEGRTHNNCVGTGICTEKYQRFWVGFQDLYGFVGLGLG